MATCKRNQQYDLLRLLLTALVVLGHGGYYTISTAFGGIDIGGAMLKAGVADTLFHGYITSVCRWIYTFHMPAFIALSGCIFSAQIVNGRYQSIVQLAKEKWKRLIEPLLFVWIFWNIPIKWVSGYYAGQSSSFLSAITQIMFPSNVYLWYLEALFLDFIFAWLLIHSIKTNVRRWIVVGSAWCIDRALLHFFGGGYIPFGQPFKWLLWFWVGMRLSDMIKRIEKAGLWNRYFFAATVGTYITGAIVCGHINHGKWMISETILPFSAIICLWYLSDKAAVFMKGKNEETLMRAAGFSFGIYLWAEPLNYLILFWADRHMGMEFFGTELGAAWIFFTRILITPVCAVFITYCLRKAQKLLHEKIGNPAI